MKSLKQYLLLIKKLLVAGLLLPALTLNAQDYVFRHYDSDNGLPSSDIFYVFQDSKGYIWIATDNGVSRYNGKEFVNFGLADGLTRNTILEIFEDSKKRIWFISLRSKLSYFQNDSIRPYKYNLLLEREFKKKIIPIKGSFFVDSSDKVFITTEGNKLRIIDSIGQITHPLPDKEYASTNFIIQKNKDKLLVNFLNDNKQDSFIYIKNNKQIKVAHPTLFNNFVKHIQAIKTGEGDFFIMLGKQVFEYKNYQLIKTHVFNKKNFWISKDHSNNIWISSAEGGVKCYFNAQIKKTPDIYLLKDYYISSVCQDSKGGYWFSTLHNGVFYLPTLNIRFYNSSNLLLKNNVSTATAHKDSIWVAYHNNYVSLIYNNKVKHIKISDNTNIETFSFLYDSLNNQLIIGIQFGFFFIINGKKVKYLDRAKINLNSFPTKDLALDNKGQLWVASGFGFFGFKNDNLIFDSRKDKNFHLRSNAVFADKKNTIWLGTVKGLWKFKNNYLEYLGNKNKLLSIRIMDIIKYKNKLILGTKGGGIIIKEKDSVWQINETDGLKSNTVLSLAKSGKYLWAGTKKGLSRIRIKEKEKPEILNIGKAHGLLTNEVRNIFISNSTLYLSSNKGLLMLNIAKIKKDSLPIPLYFTEIRINSRKMPLKKEYHLKYNQNNIYVRYESVSFQKTDNQEYRYMMIGLDKTCSSSTINELSFASLPPGKYELQITTKNKDDVWNKSPISVFFVIEKPFWQEYWFIVLVSIFIIFLIYLFIKIRINVIRKHSERQREINIYIKQALVNHMNPHFTFNTLNSINSLILNNKKEKATEYLSNFSKLMRIIIENSKKEYIPIYDEIKANIMYLEIEASRMNQKLNYQFKIDENIDQFKIKVPSLLIQPFIENAIWYGIQPAHKPGIIEVKITKENNRLKITIKDNGIGRKESIKLVKNNEVFSNQAQGTKISYKRVQLLEQIYGKKTKIEYIDIQGEESGTIVLINLPIFK